MLTLAVMLGAMSGDRASTLAILLVVALFTAYEVR